MVGLYLWATFALFGMLSVISLLEFDEPANPNIRLGWGLLFAVFACWTLYVKSQVGY